ACENVLDLLRRVTIGAAYPGESGNRFHGWPHRRDAHFQRPQPIPFDDFQANVRQAPAIVPVMVIETIGGHGFGWSSCLLGRRGSRRQGESQTEAGYEKEDI